MKQASDRRSHEVRVYLYGYCLALILTAAAFAAVYWQPAGLSTMTVIVSLALVQMVVHFRFFLKVGARESSGNHLMLLLFTAVIIALMVSGTCVLLSNLHSRMM